MNSDLLKEIVTLLAKFESESENTHHELADFIHWLLKDMLDYERNKNKRFIAHRISEKPLRITEAEIADSISHLIKRGWLVKQDFNEDAHDYPLRLSMKAIKALLTCLGDTVLKN
ncbi:hypothetical protein PQ465_12060 [Sphingobacterium oryzagri]|uniref:Uncharacterized protein n=1 Tax=Sphingobacterium oryzagri TaxID=3025669 RepID=A0ABY7WC55_9SPHI|nr:hypothetical protein [Sphingobacterium sp. KACC 22765]WDF67040.1 hypothetical protein PQ465_12060 [Sphingobacterium sp. KACC 22765]